MGKILCLLAVFALANCWVHADAATPPVSACDYTSGDAGDKINAALAALPATGGMVDARCLTGAQSAAATITVGNGTNKVVLWLGSMTLSVSNTIMVNKWSFIQGQQNSLGVGSADFPTVIKAAGCDPSMPENNCGNSGCCSNLSAVVQINGDFGGLRDLVVDGNKLGNPDNHTGDAIYVNNSDRPDFANVTAQNAPRYNWNFLSGCCARLEKVMAYGANSHGLYSSGNNDTMVSLSEFENNSGVGISLFNSPAWRIEHSDFGHNVSGGFFATGSGSGSNEKPNSSSGEILIGNQFGQNQGHDIDIEGAGFAAANQTIVGNEFIGMRGMANTYDNVHISTSCGSVVSGNVVESYTGVGQSRYGIGVWDPSGRNNGCNTIGLNSMVGTFGTSMYFDAQPYPTVENRIINPDFAVDQYNAGATHTGTFGFFTDRWELISNAVQAWNTTAQSTSGCASGARTSLLLQANGAPVTPGSTMVDTLTQNIDGGDIADFKMGMTSAQPFVFSFWAKASAAGTYSISFNNGFQTRSLVTTVNLTTSCTYYSLVIPADVGGSGANGWNPAAGQAEMQVNFDLGSGTSFQTSTLNTWQNGRYVEAVGATQLSSLASGSVNLNAIRMVAGAWDKPPLMFRIPRPYNEELALAQQFYRTSFPPGTAPAQNAGLAGAQCVRASSTSADLSLQIPLGQMRTTPQITTYNPSAANANWRDVTAGADVAVQVDPSSAKSTNGVQISSSAFPPAVNDNLCIHFAAAASF